MQSHYIKYLPPVECLGVGTVLWHSPSPHGVTRFAFSQRQIAMSSAVEEILFYYIYCCAGDLQINFKKKILNEYIIIKFEI